MNSKTTYEVQKLVDHLEKRWKSIVYPNPDLSLVKNQCSRYKRGCPEIKFRVVEITTTRKEIE